MQHERKGGVIGWIKQGPGDQRGRGIWKLPKDHDEHHPPEDSQTDSDGTKGLSPARIDVPDRNQDHDRGEDDERGVKPERCPSSIQVEGDRKSTRLNSSHIQKSRMPSSA